MEKEIVFSYKTRGDSSPKGKPRVYFTCHPEDFEKHFERICRDLFKTQDCAVYYTEDMTAELSNENNLADLGRMNLFVIPVTKLLLTGENRAVDHDLPFALERHIPVLPVMTEPGLDALYAEKFGELQYINPFSGDSSEISYEEKLRKHLQSVLVSDELAGRVRKAFDAYIFLSYRKKDRAYANELMRLIHAQPEFRDIAIWFDEFLTPGESFQENILRILESSELFALLVTPNLLEKPDGKPNYVMGEEYPAAVRLNKPVFPAEMEQTDLDSLREDFKNIPSPVDIRSDAEFRSRLLEALNRVAITENNGDPEHNFLIGLAYLEGIDVEVNAERALELITGAAEKKYVPAVKQLAKMYSSGYGVKQDIAAAIKWQSGVVDLLSDVVEETYTEADAFEFLKEDYELGELALSTEDYVRARRAYTGVYDVSKQLCFGAIGKNVFSKAKVLFKKYLLNKSFYNDAAIYLIRSCRKLLEMAFAFGNSTDIDEWSKKAMVLVRAIDYQLGNADTAVELIALSARMTSECAASGNFSGAQSWIDTAASCMEALGEDDMTRSVRLAYADLLDAASDLYAEQRKYNDAYDAEDERINVLHGLYRENNDDYSARYGMIASLLSQAEICFKAGAPDTAGELLNKVKNMAEYEAKKNDNYLLRILYSRYLLNRGRYGFATGNYQMAAELSERSYGLLEPITETKFDAKHQRRLEEAAELAGDAYVRMENFQKAFEWHKKAEDLLAGLTGISHQVRDVRTLAGVYEKLLDDSIRERKYTQIVMYYEKALFARRSLTAGIGLKTGLRMKNVAELAAEGGEEYAPYREDLNALEKLEARENEVRSIAAGCVTDGEKLRDRLHSERINHKELFNRIAELTDEVLETHTLIEIRQDLTHLSRTLKDLGSPEYRITGDAPAAQLTPAAKRICEYNASHYEPFIKYDEKLMILHAFCSNLYSTLSLGAALSKNKFVSAPGPKFIEIVFLNYPIDEIKHEDLWQMVYNWIGGN